MPILLRLRRKGRNRQNFNSTMGKPGQPYRPTSGTEGECFHERFCYQCIHERWVHRQKEDRDEDKCVVLTATLGLGTDDPGYPKEWTYGEDGKPTCTKFVKFDWGTDDDPNEPDSPRPVEPDDPAQLLMPFDITDFFPFADVVVTKHAIVEREWIEHAQ